jgi:hypothetical protein
VAVKKLNLRGGPGENFSVLGSIEKGTAITRVAEKGDWIEVAAPASTYAFVAAHYLKQNNGSVAAVNPPVANPPAGSGANPFVEPPAGPMTQIPAGPKSPVAVPTPVVDSKPVVAPVPTDLPAPPATPEIKPVDNVRLADNVPPFAANTLTNRTPMLDTNLPPRIVTHEGWVRDSVSIVAPTYYELYDPSTGKAIDYLYSKTPLLSVARYNGMKIVVNGEESLDIRWKDTPVLTIKKIYVLETNMPSVPMIPAPRKM